MKSETDGLDNPLTNDLNVALAQNGVPYDGNGCGYGDGQIDNEFIGLSHFVSYNYFSPSANMGDPIGIYNMMNGLWDDSTSWVYGGTGHFSSAPTPLQNTNYLFPGNGDPLNWGTANAGSGTTSVPFSNWTELEPNGIGSSPNTPSDIKMVSALGATTFLPFQGNLDNILEFSIAHITSFPTANNTSIETLQANTDHIRSIFSCDESGIYGNCSSPIANDQIQINENNENVLVYPNPTNNVLYIKSNQPIESIFLYDITGKNIIKKQTKNNFNQLDISNLRNGIYVLHLVDENQKITVKQVIKY